MIDDISKINYINEEKLVIEDQESINIWGMKQQNQIRMISLDFAEEISSFPYNSNLEIIDLLKDSEKIIKTLYRKYVWRDRIWGYIGHANGNELLIEKIETIISLLKIQKINLIKQNKNITDLMNILEENDTELYERIEYGLQVLNTKEEGYRDYWYKRLKNRIDNLLISHVTAINLIKGIKQVFNNNKELIDNLSINNINCLIYWKKQIEILLEIEKKRNFFSARIKIQNETNEFYNFIKKLNQLENESISIKSSLEKSQEIKGEFK